jgi:hypothetical protein
MMIGKIERRAPSLVELYRRAKLAEQARHGEPTPSADERGPARGEIISPRDERGTPYPGDFPNDLGRLYRGCF